MVDALVTELPDGRELGWLALGDPAGPAVFVIHGTPGSRRQVSFNEKPIAASGVRFLAPDRPGYGLSTFHHGRRLADWASDLAYLADHLKLERFSVVGLSGGGPHAAACACLLPERVTATAIVSGVGQMDMPGSEKGMMGFNQLISHLARRSPYLAYPPFAIAGWMFRHFPDQALRAGSRQLPASDVEIMSRPEVRESFIDDYRHASSTTSLAAAQDSYLFTRAWGFRVEDIASPVHIWHGTEDRNVPISHARVLAERIQGAELHECRGEGHGLVIDHMEEILRSVTMS